LLFQFSLCWDPKCNNISNVKVNLGFISNFNSHFAEILDVTMDLRQIK